MKNLASKKTLENTKISYYTTQIPRFQLRSEDLMSHSQVKLYVGTPKPESEVDEESFDNTFLSIKYFKLVKT